jgi:hypothetical protein
MAFTVEEPMCKSAPSSAQPMGVRTAWSKPFRPTLISWIFCAAFACALAPQAQASLMSTNNPYPSEVGLPAILSHAFGGTFTADPSDLHDFTNGSLTAVRVDDGQIGDAPAATPDGSDVLEPLGGSDDLWQGSVDSARVIGLFTGHKQTFGYFSGATGNSYQQLFAATGYGFAPDGSATSNTSLVNSASGVFRFTRDGSNGGHKPFPPDHNNFDHTDEMLTYEIQGLNNNLNTYVLAFDQMLGQCHNGGMYSDDFAVEITGPSANGQSQDPAVTPEPGTALAAVAMTLLTTRRRRPRM